MSNKRFKFPSKATISNVSLLHFCYNLHDTASTDCLVLDNMSDAPPHPRGRRFHQRKGSRDPTHLHLRQPKCLCPAIYGGRSRIGCWSYLYCQSSRHLNHPFRASRRPGVWHRRVFVAKVLVSSESPNTRTSGVTLLNALECDYHTDGIHGTGECNHTL
jgi:hypothetical protein